MRRCARTQSNAALVVMDALLAYLLGLALIAWVLRADTEKADP
jgi:hypothetical protein